MSLPAASESKPSKMSSDQRNAIARTLQPSHFLLFLLLSACDAFFTDGTEDSYVQFPRWQPCLNGSIGFEFKSEDPNGLLLYTDDGGRNDWFELRMENRKLKLRFVLFYTPNQREMQEIITSEYKDLNDNQWHKVTIKRNQKDTILSVDNFQKRTRCTSTQCIGNNQRFGTLETNSFVFLGGMPAFYRNPENLAKLTHPEIMYRERWRGQIRNVQYSNCSCPLRSAAIMKLSEARMDNHCETNNPCNQNCNCYIDPSGAQQCDCVDKSCERDNCIFVATDGTVFDFRSQKSYAFILIPIDNATWAFSFKVCSRSLTGGTDMGYAFFGARVVDEIRSLGTEWWVQEDDEANGPEWSEGISYASGYALRMDKGTEGRKAIVHLWCDETVPVTGKAIFKFIKESPVKTYVFQFIHKLACVRYRENEEGGTKRKT